MARKINRRLYDLNSPFTAKDIDKSKYSRKAAESLVLWLQMTSESPTNRANNSLSAEYEGTPAISFEPILLGPKKRNVATFSDSGNSNIKVASNIALSHSRLGNGGTPYPGSDVPFSVSAWVRFDDIETGEPHYIFGKDDGSHYEYYLYHSINQTFEISLRDTANSKEQNVESTSAVTPSDFNGKWNHIVVTYDGRGGDSAYLGIKMYINGAEHAVSDNSSESGYVGMRPNTGTGTGELYVGTAYTGGSLGGNLDGSMSEFAMWKGHALSQSEVAAIYSITQYGDSEVSGIISNPVRVLLQTEDNRTGSYPTVARPGDHDFSGKFPSIFDDTKVVEFGGTENMLYPLGVNSSSPFISGGIASPNILNGIIAPGTASAGIADLHVRFTPGENISPFDESRVYIDESIGFYSTGTITGTMAGFTQRLASKESIVIDCNPTTETTVVFSTGTQPNASGYDAGVNSGLAYYNFESSHWNVVGDLTTGSSVDYNNSQVSLRTGSYLAMSPSLYSKVSITPGNIRDFNEGIGSPIDYAGFPYATKFNATSSQLYNTSASIDSPFLIEKVTFEFSGSIGTTPWGTSTSPEQNMNSTFMLLLQRENPISEIAESSVDAIAIQAYDGSVYPTVTTGTQFEVTRDKRIIWYGRIGRFSSGVGSTWTSYDAFREGANEFIQKSCDLWIPGQPLNYNFGGDNLATSGTFKIESVPQVPSVQYPISVPLSTRVKDGGPDSIGRESVSFGRKLGGRDLRGQSDGRSFIRPFSGEKILSSSIVNNSYNGLLREMHRYQDESVDSPFLLMPGDRLVLVYANQNMPYELFGEGIASEYSLVHYRRTLLSPGAGKLTLYGSYLRDSLPKEGQSNQPLNTDAIHECLQSDIPVYDQWDVEPYVALSGSYVDNVITGSMLARLAGSFEDPIHIPDVRIVKYSVAAGQAGDQGSLQRFVRLTDHSVFAYDSVPPDAVKVVAQSGAGLLFDTFTGIAVAAPTSEIQDNLGGATLRRADSTWYLRTAYEVSSRRFVRSSYSNASGEAFNTSNSSVGSKPISVPFTNQVLFSGSITTLAGDGFGKFDTREAFPNSVKYLWGFGDGAFNLPEAVGYDGTTSTPLIRGYKYGLGGLFGSSQDARFRRDKYGQFRDMLEPRRQTATMNKNGTGLDFTIDIRFVPRDSTEGGTVNPEETHSQNLDTHSSSSLPYYDGLFVDRPDNPDLTLSPVVVE